MPLNRMLYLNINPDCTINMHVYQDEAYYYSCKLRLQTKEQVRELMQRMVERYDVCITNDEKYGG